MQWVKDNWKFIVTIITIAAAFAGIKITQTDNGVVIVFPEEVAPVQAVQGPGGLNRNFYPIARTFAARELAKRERISFVQAFAKVRKVTDADIASAAVEAGVPVGDLGDGTFLKKIVEWFQNPENIAKLMALIELILKLAALL